MYKRKTPIELNCGLDLVREVLNGKWKIHLCISFPKVQSVPEICREKFHEQRAGY